MAKRTRAEQILDTILDAPEGVQKEVVSSLLGVSISRGEKIEKESALCDLWHDYKDEIEKRDEMFGKPMGLLSGRTVTDDMTMGFVGGELTIVAAPTSVGKALADDTKVATPTGWKCIGDIVEGDTVFDSYGEPTKVIGKYPQGERDLYKVTFSNGKYVYADGNHLWTCLDNVVGKSRNDIEFYSDEKYVVNTEYLYNNFYSDARSKARIKITPLAFPCKFKHKKVKVSPYFIGAYLIGGIIIRRNGTYFIEIYCRTNEVAKKLVRSIKQYINDREVVVYDLLGTRKGKTLLLQASNSSELLSELKKMSNSEYGSISRPSKLLKPYLFNSEKVRSMVINGIADVCGSVDMSRNAIVLSGVRTRISDTLLELFGLFGAEYHEKNVGLKNEIAATVKMSFNPFSVLQNDRRRMMCTVLHKTYASVDAKNKIVNIEKGGRGSATCIAVDSHTHEFVIENGVVTHNTLYCLNLASDFLKQDRKVAFVTLEMTKVELGSRLKRILGKDISKIENLIVNKSEKMFWQSIEPFVDKAVGAGAEIIFIDHLHYFSRSLSNAAEELGQITQEFKYCAIKHNVPIVLISHTRKQQPGTNKLASIEDLRGSSYIAQDADIVLVLNNREVGANKPQADSIFITLEKNRNRLRVPIGTSWKMGKDGLILDDFLLTGGEGKEAWKQNYITAKNSYSASNSSFSSFHTDETEDEVIDNPFSI